MPDYKKMYYLLFNKITDTIEELQILQRECEEIYMSEKRPTLIDMLPQKTSDE